MKRSLVALLASASAFAMPFAAFAAQIYLDPAAGKYPPGVTFAVDVRLDNENQCVNAAEVNISYPKDVIQAVAASNGDSIFSLWIKTPTIYSDYGLVSLVGGLPGGYCGRVAGDASLSNKLATIYFRFPTSTSQNSSTLPRSAQISFLDGTRAILNDGAGTPAKLTTSGATYTQILKGKYASLDVWQAAISSDTTPPDPFTIDTYRDPSLFDNQWFAVFSTVDKQTGIDHYEVAEVPTKMQSLPESQWNWFRAVSPYLIKDQSNNNMIAVRAIDAAGNIRSERFTPARTTPLKQQKIAFLPYLAVIGIVGFAILQIVLRFF
jgi:hypothetical protein